MATTLVSPMEAHGTIKHAQEFVARGEHIDDYEAAGRVFRSLVQALNLTVTGHITRPGKTDQAQEWVVTLDNGRGGTVTTTYSAGWGAVVWMLPDTASTGWVCGGEMLNARQARKLGGRLKVWQTNAIPILCAKLRVPPAHDVVSALFVDASTVEAAADFEGWCSDLGYDTDSRKAYADWEACHKAKADLARLIPDGHLRATLEALVGAL